MIERRFYSRGDMLAQCEAFERQYGISTDAFLAADHRHDEDAIGYVPLFDRAVWRLAAHEAERLKDVPVSDPRAPA